MSLIFQSARVLANHDLDLWRASTFAGATRELRRRLLLGVAGMGVLRQTPSRKICFHYASYPSGEPIPVFFRRIPRLILGH